MRSTDRLILSFVIIAICVSSLHCIEGFLNRAVFQTNPRFLVNSTCSVNQSIPPSGTFSLETFIVPPKGLATVIIKVSVYRHTNNRFTTFYGMKNVTIDICKVFKGSITSNLIQLTADNIKKHSNILQVCPYKGRLYFDNYPLDLSIFPAYSPVGKYMGQIILITKNARKEIVIGQHKLFFEVISQKFK